SNTAELHASWTDCTDRLPANLPITRVSCCTTDRSLSSSNSDLVIGTFLEDRVFNIHAEILRQDKESAATWGASHAVFASILKALAPKTGAEIGVAYGANAESILVNTTIEKLYLIDPYTHYRNYHDCMNLDQAIFDRTYLHVIQKLQPFNGRFCIIRSYST